MHLVPSDFVPASFKSSIARDPDRILQSNLIIVGDDAEIGEI